MIVKPDSPFTVICLEERKVMVPFVANDLAARETTDRDNHDEYMCMCALVVVKETKKCIQCCFLFSYQQQKKKSS
jgi:hypothetical protein